MAFSQNDVHNLGQGFEATTDGTINIVPDNRVPMYRPRMATGSPADRKYKQKVWIVGGQPTMLKWSDTSLNQKYSFSLVSDTNAFINWEDTEMLMDIAFCRQYWNYPTANTDTIKVDGTLTDVVVNDGNALQNVEQLFTSNLITTVGQNGQLVNNKANINGTQGWRWWHGSHTLHNEFELIHNSSGRIIEDVKRADVLTQVSLNALRKSMKSEYLRKYGAELTEFYQPEVLCGSTQYMYPGFKCTPWPLSGDTNLTNSYYGASTTGLSNLLLGFTNDNAANLARFGTMMLPMETIYKPLITIPPYSDTLVNNTFLTPLTASNFSDAEIPETKTSATGSTDAVGNIKYLKASDPSVLFNAVHFQTITNHVLERTPDYMAQMQDWTHNGLGINVMDINSANIPDNWITKEVLIPSSYLYNGQLLYPKAEAYELRFTMNDISKILTIIHPPTLTANVANTLAKFIGTNVSALSETGRYAIYAKNICLNVCYEEMPADVVNKVNSRWTDPAVGLIKDFAKVTLFNPMPITAASTASNKFSVTITANDLHQVISVFGVFRKVTNLSNIRKDEYQFTDGARVGTVFKYKDGSTVATSDAAYPSKWKSFQLQIGNDLYPLLPINIDSSNIKQQQEFHTVVNEVLYDGDGRFVDNLLDANGFFGICDWNIPNIGTNLFDIKNKTYFKSGGYYGGLATKVMFGYSFKRHPNALRAGISLEGRPLTINFELTNPLAEDHDILIWVRSEATAILKPSDSTILT